MRHLRGVMAGDPDRACRELHEIGEASRNGLAQVRSLVDEYRHVGPAEVLAGARDILGAAGVRLTCRNEVGEVAELAQQVLCWVIQESVTNALRHASPTTVTIVLDRDPDEQDLARLRIRNDGVLPVTAHGPRGASRRGTGLAGLSERLVAVDGTITSIRTADGTFTVTASVPLGEE